jgi:hypothetical protein
MRILVQHAFHQKQSLTIPCQLRHHEASPVFLFLFRTDKKNSSFSPPGRKIPARNHCSPHTTLKISMAHHQGGRLGDAHPAGSFTVKVTPPVALDATVMIPPWASAICLHM